MTGASIEIRDEISPALSRLVANAENPARIMDDVAGHLLTSTQRRFETETDPDGKKWKPLSPRTAAARRGRRTRGHDNILRDSVRLYNSLTTTFDASSATVGTNVEYAAIHQLGGPIRKQERRATIYQFYDAKRDVFDQRFRSKARSNFARDVTIPAHEIQMPARAYLGINAADIAEISAIINAGLAKGIP